LSIGASYHSEADVNVKGNFTLATSPSIAAKAELNLPSRLQVGVRYAFTDALAAEFDWTRTGWSSFKDIRVTAKANGAVLTNNANNWDDADAYRFGLTYDMTSEIQLRFGYTYDKTGQNDEYFSARIPDADRQLFSAGIAHSFGEGWQVEGGYMYVKFDDNDYRSSTPFNPALSDPNGTSALSGDYKAHVHIFGIGINKTFL